MYKRQGNGVLTGLTEISDVCGNENVNGRKIPVDGRLYFQGYNVEDIICLLYTSRCV